MTCLTLANVKHVKPDPRAPLGFPILSTGGRKILTVADWEKAEQEAAKLYEQVRNSTSKSDVSLISKNTGIPEYRIQRTKNHLFFDIHELLNGKIGHFDPDIEIADAWRRLQAGNYLKQDLDLLNHEYFESKFQRIFKTDYLTAHNATIESGRTWDPYEFETLSLNWSP